MQRRDLLKLLPVSAMVPAVVKAGTSEAHAYELKPDKKYLFVVPDSIVTVEFAEALKREMSRLGINGSLLCGKLEVYELQ